MKATHLLLATALLCGAATAARADLIVNGGFETGDFTGWTASANSYPMYIVTSPVHSGTYAAQIAGYSNDPDTLSQTVSDTAGQAYTLSFWRYQTAGGPTVLLDVTWDGATVFSELNPLTRGVYQNFTATVVGTGSDTLEFASANDPGFTYLDDVSLVSATGVPEPASLALLGAGLFGLGLARRRKQG